MKSLLILLTSLLVFMVAGCQSPSHVKTINLVTDIAINHLEFEKDLALEKCNSKNIAIQECKDAEDFSKWISTLSTFKSYLKDKNTITMEAEEINFIANVILSEMGDKVDPRTKMYIQDIKAVVQMLIVDESTKSSMGRFDR